MYGSCKRRSTIELLRYCASINANVDISKQNKPNVDRTNAISSLYIFYVYKCPIELQYIVSSFNYSSKTAKIHSMDLSMIPLSSSYYNTLIMLQSRYLPFWCYAVWNTNYFQDFSQLLLDVANMPILPSHVSVIQKRLSYMIILYGVPDVWKNLTILGDFSLWALKPLTSYSSGLQFYPVVQLFNIYTKYKRPTSVQKLLQLFSEGFTHVQWVHTEQLNNSCNCTQSCLSVQYYRRYNYAYFQYWLFDVPIFNHVRANPFKTH